MATTEKPAHQPAAEPVAEPLPQSGGSYTRQPDGSLMPAQNPSTDTPEQE